MKRLILAALGCTVILVASSAGCKHDDPGPSNPGNNNTTVVNPVSGNWKVTYFTENGNDETSDYSGYTFDFATNGVFTATRNGQTTAGAWSRTTDDSKQKLVISIASAVHEIDELNEDWVIKSSTGTAMQLVDDNPASAEEIHFTRQ